MKSTIGGVPIAKMKWVARSYALSTRPRAKRSGTFLIFEFENSEGNQGTLLLGHLTAKCALSAQAINCWTVFEIVQPLSCLLFYFKISNHLIFHLFCALPLSKLLFYAFSLHLPASL